MKVLLVTSSARGHAIGDALSRSIHKPDIINICTNRNPVLRRIAAEQHTLDILNFPAILDIAKKHRPDFAVIGPDDPIGGGLADALDTMGIPSVAPKKSLARVESSKGFTRDLMEKFGIHSSPKFKVFTRPSSGNFSPREEQDSLHSFIEQELHGDYVVKYDALKGGKGVKVGGEHLRSINEGVQYAIECLDECGRVVIEEKLIGVEFSLLSFVSGTTTIDMPAVQDHKRAFADDTGPNTGGMGTYTDADHSLPFLSPDDLSKASVLNKQIATALQKECGEPYRGILYGGFIATKNGVKVIEYNARFGDPEALNILPLLTTDFVDICRGIIDGSLSDSMVSFARKATVCKYIVPMGYPEKKSEQGQLVVFPDDIPENARLYFGDVTDNAQGDLLLGGSRTAGIVGIGNTIAEAEQIAESLCKQVQGPVRFRSDIGTAKLIQQRMRMLSDLRANHAPAS